MLCGSTSLIQGKNLFFLECSKVHWQGQLSRDLGEWLAQKRGKWNFKKRKTISSFSFFWTGNDFYYELKSWGNHGYVSHRGKVKFKWSPNLITSCHSMNTINVFNNNQKSFLVSQFSYNTLKCLKLLDILKLTRPSPNPICSQLMEARLKDHSNLILSGFKLSLQVFKLVWKR